MLKLLWRASLCALKALEFPCFAGVGTLIGTAVRIPNEVLKQRLQCGQYSNVKAALGGVLKEVSAP